MGEKIRVGRVYLELPEDFIYGGNLAGTPPQIRAEKPETPEPLENPVEIYRPNDPFQYEIDQARAVASINSTHKPWVRTTWFVLFILGPSALFVLFGYSMIANQSTHSWGDFVVALVIFLLVFPPFLSIWYRRGRGK